MGCRRLRSSLNFREEEEENEEEEDPLPVGESALACFSVSVMFRNVFGRVLTVNNRILRYGIKVPFVERVPAALPSLRNFSDTKDEVPHSFDTSLLQFLVCPLSKKPLR